jgi:hypothetical protein
LLTFLPVHLAHKEVTVPFQATERNTAKTVSGGALRLGVKRLGFPKTETRGLLGNIDRGHRLKGLELNDLDISGSVPTPSTEIKA